METGGTESRATGRWARRWFGTATAGAPSLGLPDVLWFFGAISGVAAAISIVDHVSQSHRDLWELLASVGFLAGFALCAWILSRRAGRLPGGLAAGMAAAMVPAAGYGFTQLVHAYPHQQSFNPFHSFDGAVFGVALATAAAAILAYALTRVAVNLALAVGAVLLSAQLLASAWHPSLDGRSATAVVVGSVLAVVGLVLDVLHKRGEAFWLYVGGLASLTVGLDLHVFPSRDLDIWVAMLIVGTLLLVGSPFVGRRTWAAFGTVNLVSAFAMSQVATGGRGGHAIVIGGVVVGAGLLLDAVRRRRTAFWLYVGGLSALLEGLIYLTVRSPTSEPWIPMLVVGAVLLAGFVVVGRKTWVVFGVLLVAAANAAAEELASGDTRAGRALIIAGVVFLIGLGADLRRQRLTGFWLQVWGLDGVASALIFFAALSSDREGRGWIPMLVVGAILLLGASLVQRRTWIVFGAAGVAGAFGHYLLTQSGWFRYVLLAIGLGAFILGLAANRLRSRDVPA
jgi:hypothetical protein